MQKPVTVKEVFNTPYGKEIAPGKEAFEAHKKQILADALKVAKETKRDDLIKMVESGKVPEVVALIAYLNKLK